MSFHKNKKNVIPVFKPLHKTQHTDRSNKVITFLPPDEFLRIKPTCNLLVIDEAAAIPLTVLKQLIESTTRVIVSSTIDGYEGTGMGLRTKLLAYFSTLNRSVNTFELTTPQRWELNDPVEQFISSTFLVQKNTPIKNDISPTSMRNSDQVIVEKINRDLLSNDPQRVHKLFQLLTHAHYRTTPDDLRYLLDAPDIEVWIASYDGNIRGVLMVSCEGNINYAFEQDIWLGKRRLNGHLIPQSLSSQSGFRQATRFFYKRIVRIAVEEKYRRTGVASKLVGDFYNSVTQQNQNLDFIGVSYGYEPILYRFWQSMDFKPIRISHRGNTRSGLKSMIMLKPISARAKKFHQQLENNFKLDLLFNINNKKDESIDSEIVNLIDIEFTVKDDDQDQLDIYAFAFGNRQYLNCQRSLFDFTIYCLNSESLRRNINQKQIDLIKLKVLQQMEWVQTAKLLAFAGKKQILAELRVTYATLYNAVWGNKS